MLSSGILLHICVFAMIIGCRQKPPIKKDTSKSYSKDMDKTYTDTHEEILASPKDLILQLLKNMNFNWLSVSTFGGYFGLSIFITHAVAFVESQMYSTSVASMVVSAFGIAGLIGRLTFSAIMQHPKVNEIALYTLTLFLMGLYLYFLL